MSSAINYFKRDNYCVLSGTYPAYGIKSCTVSSGTIASGTTTVDWGPTIQVQFFDGMKLNRTTISGLWDIAETAKTVVTG